MLRYLCESHFWTTDEDICIKPTDLSAFKYESKIGAHKSVYVEGKRQWVEGRGGSWRGRRAGVRDTLKQLMSGAGGQCVHCQWVVGASTPVLRVLLASGCLLYIRVHPHTCQPTSLHIDKYMMGKVPNNHIHQALFLTHHVLLIYSDNQALLVSLNKPPSMKNTIPPKLSSRDPKIQMVELCGGGSAWGTSGRPVGGLSHSCDDAHILLWRRASPSDLFPWTPHNDQDNVHVYRVCSTQVKVVCNHRVEFDPVQLSFSTLHPDILFSVEQKTSKKGGVVVEWLRLRISGSSVVPEGGDTECVRMAAPAPATCAALSPCETRLLVACSDRSVLVYHAAHNLTTTVQAAFVGRQCLWWSGGVLVSSGNVQLQAWDSALAPLHLSPSSDQPPPTPHLDLSSYFKKEPLVDQVVWTQRSLLQGGFLHSDGLLLMAVHGGPLVCVRMHIPHCALELAPVVHKGLERHTLAKLRAMSWSSEGSQCLVVLHQLINRLFASPLEEDREQLVEAALGTLLAPPVPLPPATRQTHLPHLHDLCRKFFHHLIRHNKLEKALCLAIDVGHQDLFMDVHYAATTLGNQPLAQEALQSARNAEPAFSCGSCCSDPSCSGCSSDSDSESESIPGRLVDSGDTLNRAKRPHDGETVGGAPLDIYGPPLASRSPPPLPLVGRQQPPLPDITHHHHLHPRCVDVDGGPHPTRLLAAYSHQHQQRGPAGPPPERNKVKFSDTVTVAVVPQDTPRKERRAPRPGPPDWRKELADSLPLCDPNHDYLRDFTPNPVNEVPEETEKQDRVGKVKVVHFGVV